MVINPIIPNFIHAGITLYSGFTGISGIFFGGIIFGGTIKTGGLFGMGAGVGLNSIFGGGGGSGGTMGVIGAGDALYSASLEIGVNGEGGITAAGFGFGFPSRSPFMVLIIISSVCF